MKIGPGTVVLNQDSARPMSGTVVAPPEGEQEREDSVWVQWCDTTVGDDGVCEEALQDVTLTGKLVLI